MTNKETIETIDNWLKATEMTENIFPAIFNVKLEKCYHNTIYFI